MNGAYEKYVAVLKDESAPCLFLDVDALNENIAWALKNAGEKKSVLPPSRCVRWMFSDASLPLQILFRD